MQTSVVFSSLNRA